MNLLPVGAKGELFLGGEGVSQGYLDNPQMTAHSYIPNPFDMADGERLYRTGDLVIRHQSGDIEFVGRVDQQVKVRGFRIELGDIEVHLNNLSYVDAGAVVMNTSLTPPRLVAFVATQESQNLKVKADLAQILPHHMVPDIVINLPILPLMANGKTDRKKLQSEPIEFSAITDHSKPITTETEKTLALIWQEVLAIEIFSASANFFDLGGYSLMATRLVARIFNQFGVELTLKKVFEYSRLDLMAEHIDTQFWFSHNQQSGPVDDDDMDCEEGEL
jgi:acyl carrier protein